MIILLFGRIWNMRHEFIRYFVVGCSAVAVDIGTLYLLTERLHLPPVEAVIINQALILGGIFFINKHWSFKARGVTHQQVVRFLALAGANYLFAIGWMALWNGKLHFNAFIVRLVNVALSVCWNFLLYKYWVYRTDKPIEMAKIS